MNILTKFLKSDLNMLVVIAFIIFLFYGNTMFNGFVYDDTWLIEENHIIKDLRNLPKVFTACINASSSTECDKSGVYYRPIQNLQLMLTFQIGNQPWIFHFVSLLILFFVSVSVFTLFKRLIKISAFAFIGTILFLIHPIISENINMVSALTEQYMAIFFVLSFIFYIKYSDSNKTKYLLFSSIFYLLALFAKETAALLFLAFFAYDFLFKKKKILINMLFFICPFLIYLLVRYIILGHIIHNLTGYHNLDQKTTFLTSIFTFPLYLSKLIIPWFLNAQPDPIIIKTINFNFFLGLAGWLVFLTLFYLAIKKRLKLMVLGLIIIFLSLLPVIIFIDRIGRFIFDEGRLFVATVGFSLIVFDLVRMICARHSGKRGADEGARLLDRRGSSASRISKKTDSGVLASLVPRMTTLQKAFLFLFVLYLVTSWYTVFNRNKDWHDEFSFNKSIARYAKSNFGVYYNLGGNYFDIKDYENAADTYKKAIHINPNFWEAHFNLANTYLRLQKQDKAENEYKAVILLNPFSNYARNAIENIRLIKSGTLSANFSLRGETIQYKNDPSAGSTSSLHAGSGLSFDFPAGFVLEKKSPITIKGDSSFTIEITVDSLVESPTNYLSWNRKTYGQLINQGLAQIPQFDYAYVKIFIDGGVQKHQFFLFSKEKVVKVLVYPSDSTLMKLFDVILGSIKID